MESYKIIRQVLQKLPAGDICVKAPRKIPAGEALSRYEAPRGEDMHYVKANGTEKPDRVKVRAPTLANVQSVKTMLQDRNLADMPIVIAAIDPCFSCTDRMTQVTNVADGSRQVWDWEKLRLQGIEWYRKRGVDFTALNNKLKQRL
jgi:NADH-quinone oxidoreductase subunit D